MSTPAVSRFDVVQKPSPRQAVCSPQASPVTSVQLGHCKLRPHCPRLMRSENGTASAHTAETRFYGERLVKAITRRAKVFFCSDLHRFADANAKNKAAKKLRQAKGVCPSLSRTRLHACKSASALQQMRNRD